MAKHRARHRASETGSVLLSDLVAPSHSRHDGARPSGHRHAATRPSLVAPALSSLLSASAPALPPARSRRTMIAAVSVGALGVTATIAATTEAAPSTPQANDAQAAVLPAPVAVAAAFAAPGSGPADVTPSTVTGADLAADALPPAAPAPDPAAAPGSADRGPAPSVTDGTDSPTPAGAADQKTDPAEADAGTSEATDDAAADRQAADRAATEAAAQEAATQKAAADKAAADKAAAAAAKQADAAEGAAAEPAGGSSAGMKALTFAKAAIGKPYRFGAVGPNAFDCSGLVMSSFKKAGVSLPRTSRAQSQIGTPVSRDQLQPGDLVFFYSPVSHVGIYLGDGKMVNASTSGQPVKVSSIGGRLFHNARRI